MNIIFHICPLILHTGNLTTTFPKTFSSVGIYWNKLEPVAVKVHILDRICDNTAVGLRDQS